MVRFLKCIWLHPYTVTWTKLPPVFLCQGHLKGENDVITSWLKLIPNSDLFIHPYWINIMCFNYWYAVSSAYGCTLVLLYGPSCPQIWYARVTWGVNTSQLRLISISDLFIHLYWTSYIKCFKHWYTLSSAYGCTPILLHGPSCPQIWYVRVTWGV